MKTLQEESSIKILEDSVQKNAKEDGLGKGTALTLEVLDEAIELIKKTMPPVYYPNFPFGYMEYANENVFAMPKLMKAMKKMDLDQSLDEISIKDFFKIPDVTYNIPVSEFFSWYDKILDNEFGSMSIRERIDYFNNMNPTTTKSIKKAVQATKDKIFIDRTEGIKGEVIYYKLDKFYTLEGDATLLQKMMRQFLVEKSITKMQGSETQDEVPNKSSVHAGKFFTKFNNISKEPKTKRNFTFKTWREISGH